MKPRFGVLTSEGNFNPYALFRYRYPACSLFYWDRWGKFKNLWKSNL